jgi:hypothetical protein
MTVQSKTTLKGYFNSGDTPSEANFTDLIDSLTEEAAIDTKQYARQDGVWAEVAASIPVTLKIYMSTNFT